MNFFLKILSSVIIFFILASNISAQNIPEKLDSLSVKNFLSYSADDTAGKSKIKIIKRKVPFPDFVIIAACVMAYTAIILSTTQAWNPQGQQP